MARVLLLLALVMLFGCTPWQVEYLEEVTGKATQEEITRKFGPPLSEQVLSSGETIWLYRFRGAAASKGTGTTWCREYVLTFDTQKVLRQWNRQSC